jgi:hypothetical protein
MVHMYVDKISAMQLPTVNLFDYTGWQISILDVAILGLYRQFIYIYLYMYIYVDVVIFFQPALHLNVSSTTNPPPTPAALY